MATQFIDEIDTKLYQAKAIADLLGLSDPAQISKETLTNLASALSVLIEDAADLYTEQYPHRRAA